ncbi:hypothetical protein GQ600_10704 [Phytophthora cactorum]|nr:hypothetical protein GQ600_10704 [Phytophthora cactorum]
MPSLATVQRFVQHYRHAHLGGSDFYDDITIWHADKAQGNAIDLVLGVDNELRTRGNPLLLAAQVVQDIADMHYATTADDILTAKTRSLKAWEKLPQLCSFANYFSTVWLNSAFHP